MRSFLNRKVDGVMIFINYWIVLILKFSEMGNTFYFWARQLMERLYLVFTEKFLFWTFVDGKYGLLLSQKVNGTMIFTCFRAFHDIPGNGKYGFSCRENSNYSNIFPTFTCGSTINNLWRIDIMQSFAHMNSFLYQSDLR